MTAIHSPQFTEFRNSIEAQQAYERQASIDEVQRLIDCTQAFIQRELDNLTMEDIGEVLRMYFGFIKLRRLLSSFKM